MEKSETGAVPRKAVSAREMMAVLNQMSSSPVAMFVKGCSEQQKMMLAAVVRCVRREGVSEIAWRSVSLRMVTHLGQRQPALWVAVAVDPRTFASTWSPSTPTHLHTSPFTLDVC